jgi:hypothetical protein
MVVPRKRVIIMKSEGLSIQVGILIQIKYNIIKYKFYQ